MKFIIGVFCTLLAIAVFQISCFDVGKTIVSSNGNSNADLRRKNTSNPDSLSANSDDSLTYLGCWSSYRGDLLKITKEQLLISVNSYKPAKYIESSEKAGENVILLKLEDRPQFHYFQDYLTIEYRTNEFSEREIVIRDYTKYEDALESKGGGRSAWVETPCDFLPKNRTSIK